MSGPIKWQKIWQKLQTWSQQGWESIVAWLKAQPRWRLAMYGLGGPLLLGVLFVLILTTLVWQGAFGPLPTYAALQNIENDQASEIYSEDGVLLGKYYIENRTNARLDEISPLVINALVATEDARFFEHSGIDIRAWGRVLVKSILLRNESAGGGSTLSQQLAKNLYPRQRHWLFSILINKVKEMLTARRLEQLYTKEELLRLYLNTVPFGDNAFGIKVAAFRFFNQLPENLKVEEAATLVGMLKGTSAYNPRRHLEAATQRRNIVLAQMQRAGHLEQNELDSLRALELALDYQQEGQNEGIATYFRAHLRQELATIVAALKKPDGSPYNLYTDGLKIYTTINSRMQQHAEGAVAYQMPFVQQRFYDDWKKRRPWSDRTLQRALERTSRYQQLKRQGRTEEEIETHFLEPHEMTIFVWGEGAVDTLMSPLDSLQHYMALLNVGLLSAEPNTGLVRAWVGGGDHRFVQYDHVKSRRPVGSTFKPIVYTAALQSGMMPCEYTPNEQKVYEQYENWQPRNSDGEYGGAYSLAGALSNSVNTIAVELALRAGLPNVRKLAEKMGIERGVPEVPAIALGAVEASLQEMVTVYSTFANRGYRPARLHYLDRIEAANGEVLISYDRPDPDRFEKVLEPGHADMMLEIMQSVVDSGTARRLRTTFGLRGTLMGKTGTTQDQSDGWFVGFNPKMVTGVWVGSDHPGIHYRTLYRGQASRTALPVFGSYTLRVYKDSEFRSIRRATYPNPPEMVQALLQCPPYLPEMPIVDFLDGEVDEMLAWNRLIESIDPPSLQALLNEHPRRRSETLGRYALRIRRIYDRQERRDEKRAERKEHWSRILFGKKEGDG